MAGKISEVLVLSPGIEFLFDNFGSLMNTFEVYNEGRYKY